MTSSPQVVEDIIPVGLPPGAAAELAHIAGEAGAQVGARLVTVSLWRAGSRDLVRVHSSRPEVYAVGGISRVLGAEWLQRCVEDQESYLAEDEAAVNSDAFEHHDVLAALQLSAAVNAVVVDNGSFLGCLNLLDGAGRYTAQSVALAESYAAQLAAVLRRIPHPRG
ncbi:GAF domain-containing protein [Arthrobacter sp. 35W]|uniref:GAF domain-containing protein n=1 Tax=Arthrobacter sp. 35W TaxID=1132441 RepID=UPI00040DE9B2|nr:GAF domain-containing protein [Arthrobacter sp. 35W]